jgi:hypothetical protein
MLKRYWFEFERSSFSKLPPGIDLGCGITAYNYDDAIFLLNKEVFKDRPMPSIKKVIENVDVSTLDAGHVLLNMLPPNLRGIWFPFGFNDFK